MFVARNSGEVMTAREGAAGAAERVDHGRGRARRRRRPVALAPGTERLDVFEGTVASFQAVRRARGQRALDRFAHELGPALKRSLAGVVQREGAARHEPTPAALYGGECAGANARPNRAVGQAEEGRDFMNREVHGCEKRRVIDCRSRQRLPRNAQPSRVIESRAKGRGGGAGGGAGEPKTSVDEPVDHRVPPALVRGATPVGAVPVGPATDGAMNAELGACGVVDGSFAVGSWSVQTPLPNKAVQVQ